MTLCLFEDATVARLAPLALTRAAFDLRIGARTLAESALAAFAPDGLAPEALAVHTREHVLGVTLEEHPEARPLAEVTGPVLYVNGRWRVRPGALVDRIRGVAESGASGVQAWVQGETLLAVWAPDGSADVLSDSSEISPEAVEGETVISRLWHLVEDVAARITEDVEAMGGLGTHKGADVHPAAVLVAPERIHLAPEARVTPGAVLDASGGPVHLARGARVGANAVVVGPCWIGPGATVNAACRIDGSAVGERSKVGGEVHASIVHSFCNKGHDGYL
ncbi:MAG: putative sugar nucleotidyl transferase, partial [Bacteroidota bacterium]